MKWKYEIFVIPCFLYPLVPCSTLLRFKLIKTTSLAAVSQAYGEELANLGDTDKLASQAQAMRQQAQQTASENVGARVKLNVSIQAPVIIIPRNSRSTNVVVADLGRLEVSSGYCGVRMWSGVGNGGVG